MSFFKKIFPKRAPKPIPIDSIEDELSFLKETLGQSLSKTFLLQRIQPQEIDLKEQTDTELIFQGQFGFFLLKLNEDAEIYHFLYTDLAGTSHQLVKGDHHNYGHIVFKDEKKGTDPK